MIFLYEPYPRCSDIQAVGSQLRDVAGQLPGIVLSESHNNTRSGATVCDSKQYSVSARVPNRGLYQVSETMTSFWRP